MHMCIAIYKPSGAQFPSKETLRTCFTNNPDGAGFAYSDGRSMIIRKGYFDFDSFYGALKKAKKQSRTGDFLIHFRISTQGGINSDNCHPFPLSTNDDDLRKRFVKSDYAIIHNGIIPLTSDYSYYGWSKKDPKKYSPSDTALFVRDYLTLIINGPGYYKDTRKRQLITRLIESKMAIMYKNGHCELFGDGWKKDGGVWYSNDTYKAKKTTYSYSTGYSSWTPKTESKDKLIPLDEKDDYDDLKWDMYRFTVSGETFYDFDPIDCPCAMEGTDAYCDLCFNHESCYGHPGAYDYFMEDKWIENYNRKTPT